jgi:hypothetical protein
MKIDNLLISIDQAFDRKSWHGTNLRGSIRGLDIESAKWRPAKGRHNIWEIVLHCAYWKYVVKRRITGEKRGSFPLKGSNWFERPIAEVDQATLWKSDAALLAAIHREMRSVIAALSSRDLSKTAHGGKETVLDLVLGVAAHDLYHAGQIQLIKRLRSNLK